MKSLFAVLMTVFFVYSLSACDNSSDPVDPPGDVDVATDASVSTDVVVDDVLSGETDETGTDATQEETSGEDASAAGDLPEAPEEEEQLPSDPTENPDQEASYYEFPAWHIP